MQSITKQYIKDNLLSILGKLSSQKIRTHNITLTTEQLYCIYNEINNPPRCQCCDNFTKFKSFSIGYTRFCSAKCSSNSISTKEKRKNTNLIKYGVESSFQSQDIKDKIKNSNLIKYGVEHHTQLPDIIQKRKDTCIEIYGVEVPTQSNIVQENRKKSNLEKYGVLHHMQIPYINEKSKENRKTKWLPKKLESIKEFVIPDFQIDHYKNIDVKENWRCSKCHNSIHSTLSDGKIPRCFVCYPRSHRSSKMESAIADFIKSLNFEIIQNSRDVIAPLEIDIFVPTSNLAIEINGTYWHSENQGRTKFYHYNKLIACQSSGIRLIQILSSEWNDNPDLIKSRLKSILGVNKRIFARNCQIKNISHVDSVNFFDANHIQKSCNSKIQLGLFIEGNLVAAMSFGKSRFNKTLDWELLRYASIQDFNVIGGASKLFSYFIKQHTPISIISYCDLRWNNGNLYNRLGFTKTKTSPPNYWYTINYEILESRIKYQKHKLKDILTNYEESLTEWENMKNNNYDRIWDCGSAVFEWKAFDK